MKKNYNPITSLPVFCRGRNKWKLPLYSALLLLLFVIYPPGLSAQQGRLITLDRDRVTLQQLFGELERQGYTFAYKTEDVADAGPVRVRVSNATIDRVMDAALAGTGLSFSVSGSRVTVFRSTGQQPATNTTYDVRGKVVDAESGEPLANVAIQFVDQPLWAVSDAQGDFSIPKVRAGTYDMEISLLGYQKVQRRVTVPLAAPLVVQMRVQNLKLDQVVVTAQQKKMGSSSVIDRAAISHTQAKSLSDLLQLMPGVLTANPSLDNAGQAMLREMGNNNRNAQGVSVVLDGNVLSNDGNLQVLSVPRNGDNWFTTLNYGLGQGQTTSGRGIDLRTITPDNIESVEVIRGIASAQYGNLSSGMMIVKSRAGYTPYEVKAQADAHSKYVFAGKGFDLGGKWGALNISADYTQSYDDIREKFNGYERITGTLGYSTTFMRETRPLTLNFRGSYYRNTNMDRNDPDAGREEYRENANEGFRLSLGGLWRIDGAVLSNIEYLVAVNGNHSVDTRNRQITNQGGLIAVGGAYETSEYEGYLVPATYYSKTVVDGRPLDMQARLKFDRLFQLGGGSYNTVMAGAEFDYVANNGDGLWFDPTTPPEPSEISVLRPRSFKDIPAMKTVNAFIEDQLGLRLGSTRLTLIGGVRFSNLFVDRKTAGQGNISVFDPRFTAEYIFLNSENNSVFDELGVVGGYGIMSKMPTMSYLYPDRAYFDAKGASVKYGEDKFFSVISTFAYDTANPDLKPSRMRKFEGGVFGGAKGVRFSATYYNELNKNEFAFQQTPVLFGYNSYDGFPDDVTDIRFTNGKVYYDTPDLTGQELVAERRQRAYSYGKVTNDGYTSKWGVEYSVSFPEIRAVRTTLTLDGAWMNTKRYGQGLVYNTSVSTDRTYPYIAIMPAGDGSSRERFNTTFRFVTHIPRLRMIFSTTAEVVWMEKWRNFYRDGSKDLFYVAPDFSDPDTRRYMIDPVAYMDMDGNIHQWTAADREDTQKQRMIRMLDHDGPDYFARESSPVRVILNFRLTKEIGDVAELSFVANNFLNMSYRYRKLNAKGYYYDGIPVYFGADLKLKF